MPETTKITIERPGRPDLIVSLDDDGWCVGATGPIPWENGPKTAEKAAEPAENGRFRALSELEHLQRILDRLQDAPRAASVIELAVSSIQREILERLIKQALVPRFMLRPGVLSDADLRLLHQPGGSVWVKPAVESEMDDVLDSYRLAGRMCGVQVFAVDHVVAWVGDIEDAMRSTIPHIRGLPGPVPFFHSSRGTNAVEDAAKWLRSQLEVRAASASGLAGKSSGEIGR